MNRGIHLQVGDWRTLGVEALAVRTAVFVREQGIALEIEHDANDAVSLHCIARLDGRAIGTGRLLPDGHVGRMAVLAEARRIGVGRRILGELLAQAADHGHARVELAAQRYVEAFYRAQGFESIGEPFVEAGIEHIRMQRIVARR